MASKGKILVVDDDRLVLAMVTHGLAQAGYEVIDDDNGDDAILLARQERPDLALLDIRMYGKSGFDVAQYLREVGHTPFVFLSAFSDPQTVAKVKELARWPIWSSRWRSSRSFPRSMPLSRGRASCARPPLRPQRRPPATMRSCWPPWCHWPWVS